MADVLAATEPGPRHRAARPSPSLMQQLQPMTQEAAEEARVIVKYRADSPMRRILSATGGETGSGGNAGSTSDTQRPPLHAQSLSQRMNLPLRDGRVLGPHTQSLRAMGLRSSELAARLRQQADVEWAVVDERRRLLNVPNDPLLADNQASSLPTAGQWYLRAPTAERVSAINALGAWTVTQGSAAVTVAVLDTGVRLDHPDLAGKLVKGYDFVGVDRGGATTTAGDGDGRDDDPSDPGDWTNANECASGEPASESSWHGTQVAGLIGAATNNGVGMAGVGWTTRVQPVRVLGRCGGYDSDIIAAMRWAGGLSDNVGVGAVVNVPNPTPARIVNMSLGSQGTCTPAYQAVVSDLVAAGVTIVAAAGNDTGLKVSVPANCTGVIAVSGVRHAGTKVGYSNIGPEVSIAAPAGNCVNLEGPCLYPLLTSVNLGARSPGANGYSDSSNYTVGTSFASPLVAGTVALMLAVDDTLTPAGIRDILRSTARTFPSTGAAADVVACRAPDTQDQLECYCTTSTCGAGLLDASAAIARTVALRPPSLPTTPVIVTAPGSSGGGFSGFWWLLGLLCGTGALHALRRRDTRRVQHG